MRKPLELSLTHEALIRLMAGLDRETRLSGKSLIELLAETLRDAGFRGPLQRIESPASDATIYQYTFAVEDPKELPTFVARVFKVSPT